MANYVCLFVREPQLKSLQAIIEKEGDATVAAKLGFSESYMRHIRTGFRIPSSNVLRKAQAVYGKRLNVAASLSAVSVSRAA